MDFKLFVTRFNTAKIQTEKITIAIMISIKVNADNFFIKNFYIKNKILIKKQKLKSIWEISYQLLVFNY
jgi:hypothetical protein